MNSGEAPSVCCRICGRTWPASYNLCPEDGADLAPTTTTQLPDATSRLTAEAEPERSTDRMLTTGSVTARAADTGTFTEIVAPYTGSSTDLAHRKATAERAANRMTMASASHAIAIAESHELMPGTPISEYLVEGKLGEGAMGAVYTARHPAIGKRVAIKIMNPRLSREPESVERFIGEARAVAAIQHPGIVDVFGFGSLRDGRLYLVMELLQGESLRDRIQRGRLSLTDALEVLDQIARALEVAHDHGIIHRDLKPENVFLERVAKEPRPTIKILDFGLAKLIDEGSDARLRRTQSGQLLGTPLYMSPEQCRAKQVDHRTDIYALGCMAYEVFCGRVPFDADNTAELIAAHLGERPPFPRELWPAIPPALDELFFAMLAKESANRPTLDQIRQTLSLLREMHPARPQTPLPIADPSTSPSWSNLGAPSHARVRPATARSTLSSSTGELQAVRGRSRTKLVGAAAAAVALVAVVAIVMIASQTPERDRREPEVAATVPASTTPDADAAAPPPTQLPARVGADASVAVGSGEPMPSVTTVMPIDKPRVDKPRVDKPRVKTAPDKSDKPRPPSESPGTLTLSSSPACDILVDGKATHFRTPHDLKLEAGDHRIMLINGELGIKDAFTVTVQPGETLRVPKDYSNRIVEKRDSNSTTINPFKKKKPVP